MEHLCRNPLKFILFIDDLTFSENDPNFGTLKATLEGSIAARMKNTVIYATSNRRHLVKETFDDGSATSTQNDTVQERISLSERFGITVTYSQTAERTCIWKSSTAWRNRLACTWMHRSWTWKQNNSHSENAEEVPVLQEQFIDTAADLKSQAA